MEEGTQQPAPGWYTYTDAPSEDFWRYWDGEQWQGQIHELGRLTIWKRFGPGLLMFVVGFLAVNFLVGGMDAQFGLDSWARDTQGISLLAILAIWIWARLIIRSRPRFPDPPYDFIHSDDDGS